MQTSSHNETATLARPRPLRTRQIAEPDLPALASLLEQGYPSFSQAFWLAALRHMRDRDTPCGYPRYGFMLESDGVPVGVILTVFAAVGHDGVEQVRCNVSSWYVDPVFRGNGALLLSQVFRLKDVTVLNTSALPHTWPILHHQGYTRYSQGQVVCVPALSPPIRARVRTYRDTDAARMRNPAEAALMAYHAQRGCPALVCETAQGLVPFVFLRRKIFKLGVPYAQLAYCRDTADFVRLAGPLGRWLLRRGLALAVLDAEAAAPNLIGRFLQDRIPKFYRGPVRPRLNDLAYTEAVVLGI